MAEATGLRNNVLPYPVYGVPFSLVFPILDADGDLVTGAADLDSEISLNGDTGADCTNEATEIAAGSGTYYLSLTAAEMTTNVATGITKTSTAGAKTTTWALYPRVLPVLRAATAQAGAAGTITLDANAVPVDDFYNGTVIYIHTGTGAGQARVITDYVGSTKVASVTPNFATNPANDSQFNIYLTDVACNAVAANLAAIANAAVSATTAQLGVNVVNWKGSAAAAMTGDAYAEVTSGTYGLSIIEGLVDDLEGRLTAQRAGYLDNLSVGAVALEATLTAMQGATFNGATDSLEALRDRGDAAWITATGFSTHDAAAVKTAIEAGGSSIASILADTGELQADWVNGGRLDLLIDAVKAATDKLTFEALTNFLQVVPQNWDDVSLADATALTANSAGALLRAVMWFLLTGKGTIVKASGEGAFTKTNGTTAGGTYTLSYNIGTDTYTRTAVVLA